MLIIADSHVDSGTAGETEFFALLELVSSTSHDVCFAGDIMELWLGVPGYETDLHYRFLDWCRREKSRRKIYFVEGNHEFFVVKHHGDIFAAASQESLRIGKLLICHGDGLPGQNWSHQVFRRLSKSWFAEFLVKWLPGAKALVRCIKRRFEAAARRRALREGSAGYLYPETVAAIEDWRKVNPGGDDSPTVLLLGHFHCEYLADDGDGVPVCLMPAWRDSRRFVLANPETGEYALASEI